MKDLLGRKADSKYRYVWFVERGTAAMAYKVLEVL